MTKAQEEMLEHCGGDMEAYNNMIVFGNFLCDMILKYGKDVLAEIEQEEAEKAKKAKIIKTKKEKSEKTEQPEVKKTEDTHKSSGKKR